MAPCGNGENAFFSVKTKVSLVQRGIARTRPRKAFNPFRTLSDNRFATICEKFLQGPQSPVKQLICLFYCVLALFSRSLKHSPKRIRFPLRSWKARPAGNGRAPERSFGPEQIAGQRDRTFAFEAGPQKDRQKFSIGQRRGAPRRKLFSRTIAEGDFPDAHSRGLLKAGEAIVHANRSTRPIR